MRFLRSVSGPVWGSLLSLVLRLILVLDLVLRLVLDLSISDLSNYMRNIQSNGRINRIYLII